MRGDDIGGDWRGGVEEKMDESWRVRVRVRVRVMVRVRRHRLFAIVLPLPTVREVSSYLGFSDTVVSGLGWVGPFGTRVILLSEVVYFSFIIELEF